MQRDPYIGRRGGCHGAHKSTARRAVWRPSSVRPARAYNQSRLCQIAATSYWRLRAPQRSVVSASATRGSPAPLPDIVITKVRSGRDGK